MAAASGIVPAQPGFLAIYNPSLGTTDETVADQIVYYSSASSIQAGSKRRRHHRGPHQRDPAESGSGDVSNEERNEQLRQIGLAQAMVEFGRNFSRGQPVDAIDTERSRVVLHELEPGWWILASIDLTRLPLPRSKTSTTQPPPPPPALNAPSPPPTDPSSPSQDQKYDYSTREVKPAPPPRSLATLFATRPRAHCAALLARHWDAFLGSWSVLLHGNPACAVLGGLKVAASGELGVGVGEEDRGSAERAVLEGLVGRVPGLVDLLVGWLGVGNEVGAEDGAVFLGVGALSRQSLRALVAWMEEIYAWGENAYGLREIQIGSQQWCGSEPPSAAKDAPNETGGMDKMLSYLKLGYGTYWSLGTASPAASSDADDETAQPTDTEGAASLPPARNLNTGYFLLGLGDQGANTPEQPEPPAGEGGKRFPTVTVELEDSEGSRRTARLRPVVYIHRPFIYILLFDPQSNPPTPWAELSQSLPTELSALHKPLLSSTAYRPEKPLPTTATSSSAQTNPLDPSSAIYDLVFDPATLTIHSTIPNIPDPPIPASSSSPFSVAASPWTRVEALATHAQLLSMYAAARADPAARERTCKTARGWWVVWNRIGGGGGAFAGGTDSRDNAGGGGGGGGADAPAGEEDDDDWGRETKGGGGGGGGAVGKEVFLVRRASDHGPGVSGLRGVSGSYVGGGGGGGDGRGNGGGGGWADGASRLAQGIGVDTRRYIEALLSLNR
ncbi:939c568e-c2fc-4be1-afc6-294d00af961f [Thermothielavioides terrestris]|uniref:939c568e-c2fc-4be1-afc6-294d00af961f n=1 Tax=Thermothielavioides terrestris TaxID=2587410 RepID=A0A3S4AT12_9PEZI|nr:939c568e-c2fc-4be1-afc6-294d00af961f [Thermothielavioides terrestris]